MRAFLSACRMDLGCEHEFAFGLSLQQRQRQPHVCMALRKAALPRQQHESYFMCQKRTSRLACVSGATLTTFNYVGLNNCKAILPAGCNGMHAGLERLVGSKQNSQDLHGSWQCSRQNRPVSNKTVSDAAWPHACSVKTNQAGDRFTVSSMRQNRRRSAAWWSQDVLVSCSHW